MQHTTDEDAPGQEEVNGLAKILSDIFPDIDKEYIRARARGLEGHPAAIEGFVDELLRDPRPPANWRLAYAVPPPRPVLQLPDIDQQDDQGRPVEAVAGPSGQSRPAADQEEVAPEVRWEAQKEDELKLIFPHYSPEWLLGQNG